MAEDQEQRVTETGPWPGGRYNRWAAVPEGRERVYTNDDDFGEVEVDLEQTWLEPPSRKPIKISPVKEWSPEFQSDVELTFTSDEETHFQPSLNAKQEHELAARKQAAAQSACVLFACKQQCEDVLSALQQQMDRVERDRQRLKEEERQAEQDGLLVLAKLSREITDCEAGLEAEIASEHKAVLEKKLGELHQKRLQIAVPLERLKARNRRLQLDKSDVRGPRTAALESQRTKQAHDQCVTPPPTPLRADSVQPQSTATGPEALIALLSHTAPSVGSLSAPCDHSHDQPPLKRSRSEPSSAPQRKGSLRVTARRAIQSPSLSQSCEPEQLATVPTPMHSLKSAAAYDDATLCATGLMTSGRVSEREKKWHLASFIKGDIQSPAWTLTEMPEDVLFLICYYLEGEDLLNLERSCRRFSSFIETNREHLYHKALELRQRRATAKSLMDAIGAVIEAEPIKGTYRTHMEAILKTVRLLQTHSIQGSGIRMYSRSRIKLNKELFGRIRPLKDDGTRRIVAAAKAEAAKVAEILCDIPLMKVHGRVYLTELDDEAQNVGDDDCNDDACAAEGQARALISVTPVDIQSVRIHIDLQTTPVQLQWDENTDLGAQYAVYRKIYDDVKLRFTEVRGELKDILVLDGGKSMLMVCTEGPVPGKVRVTRCAPRRITRTIVNRKVLMEDLPPEARQALVSIGLINIDETYQTKFFRNLVSESSAKAISSMRVDSINNKPPVWTDYNPLSTNSFK